MRYPDLATSIVHYFHAVIGFSTIGVLFDVAVCYLGKDLDLYGAAESDRRREFVKEDAATDGVSTDKMKEVNGNLNQRIEHSHL
jgi:sugar/nucleoside kinase (ribokinase family)